MGLTDTNVLEYLEFTQLSNRSKRPGLQSWVLEYLEFTQLSNKEAEMKKIILVLEYLEFTQLSNGRRRRYA